uniref:Uncharacterized protein n=2 Tax=Aegilops tauschii subsp. strangulata TaxID=200361 RepID=A0A453ETC0_AEGTS
HELDISSRSPFSLLVLAKRRRRRLPSSRRSRRMRARRMWLYRRALHLRRLINGTLRGSLLFQLRPRPRHRRRRGFGVPGGSCPTPTALPRADAAGSWPVEEELDADCSSAWSCSPPTRPCEGRGDGSTAPSSSDVLLLVPWRSTPTLAPVLSFHVLHCSNELSTNLHKRLLKLIWAITYPRPLTFY